MTPEEAYEAGASRDYQHDCFAGQLLDSLPALFQIAETKAETLAVLAGAATGFNETAGRVEAGRAGDPPDPPATDRWLDGRPDQAPAARAGFKWSWDRAHQAVLDYPETPTEMATALRGVAYACLVHGRNLAAGE